MSNNAHIITADVLDGLAQIESGTVHTCVTSPPYWGLRDYGIDGQIGLEETPDAYVARIVDVFREVPPALAETCIKAGCPEGGLVLDPFTGAGTTALVAMQLNRRFVGCEINPEYVTIAQGRLRGVVVRDDVLQADLFAGSAR